ncbi:response regulator [Leptospira ognonensis]|uniref:Response regulator n=1 Tax=Leptospira ognonensis TaxID=2484945 RepID=A0A4R9K1E2_9LEPT|nr:response regulator [Leptospira ognonensis]TGL57925.1 response regulator [Leptospira ognonensis]
MEAKKKILIVEDEALHALHLKKILKNKGFEISGVVSIGDEVFKSVEKDCPDIALMDITLRNSIDGIEVTNILRKRYNFPVIFISGYNDEATLKKTSLITNTWKLTKPISETVLLKLIASVLKDV